MEVHSAVSLLWFGWFFFLLIALVTALPQKNLYPPYWFCPQEHTDTHSRAFPFSYLFINLFTFINPLMQNKMCTCGNLRVFSSVCPSDVLHCSLSWVRACSQSSWGEQKSVHVGGVGSNASQKQAHYTDLWHFAVMLKHNLIQTLCPLLSQ